MATVKEITTMCKAGNVTEAYEIAQTDLNTYPQDIWKQRAMGWALYYLLKADIEKKDSSNFIFHFEEFSNLNLLTPAKDSAIFEQIVWKLAEFIRTIPTDASTEMDKLFSLFHKYEFTASRGYSSLLIACLRFKTWNHLPDFLEWWNLDKLSPEDYQPFQMEGGKKACL